ISAVELALYVLNYTLIVTAVNRFVYVMVEDANHNTLTLENYNLRKLSWFYKSGKIHIAKSSNATRFVEQALKITYDYLIENKYETTPIKLNIKSELADSSGRKYGLGSSADVVTSVVQDV